MYIDSLVEYDNYGICQPCLAESWERSDDGLTWTFHIRKGVPWMTFECKEYGEDVTANDFVTSCKYILDPDNGSRLADMMFTIAGAEDYYNAKAAGKDADFSSVGVKALTTTHCNTHLQSPALIFFLPPHTRISSRQIRNSLMKWETSSPRTIRPCCTAASIS